jgi:hypothetical protein
VNVPQVAANLASAPTKATWTATWHSFLYTAGGLVAGFLGGAALAGAASSPAALWNYTHATWFFFVITQVVTPLLRGGIQQAKGSHAPQT